MKDHGLTLDEDLWRVGLAISLFPEKLPAKQAAFHSTKNAMIFGWTPGGILVAKHEATDVHGGTTVTDPTWQLLWRHTRVVVELMSRSAKVLRDVVGSLA